MRFAAQPYFLSLCFLCWLLPSSAIAADDDTALGYSSGLNGDVPNSAVTLPPRPPVTIPNGVRPVIVLPPESLEPHTLIVPLPSESSPPVILRRNSVQEVPIIYPQLPRSNVKNGSNATNQQEESKAGKGSTIKTTPLDPIVY